MRSRITSVLTSVFQSSRLRVLLHMNYTQHTIFTLVELYNALAQQQRQQHQAAMTKG